jgi:hypothetical protein
LIWIFYDTNFAQDTSMMLWKELFKQVVLVFKIFYCKTIDNFAKINIITFNYAYYMIVYLTLWYEYSTILIFPKHKQDALETLV